MRRRSLLLVLVASVWLGCQPPELSRAEILRQEQELEGLLNRWVRHMNNAHVDSLLSLYEQSPMLRWIQPSGAVARGYQETEQAIRDFYASIGYMNFVLQDPSTELLAPGVGLSSFGHSTDIVGADRVRRPVTAGRGTIVWTRNAATADEWRIHLVQLSANQRSPN